MRKQKISLTTDSVIFFGKKPHLKILLVNRKNPPFQGKWALPGGFLKEEESLEAGAKRELEEETGLKISQMKQIKAFGTPHRDPRGRTISVAFWAHILSEEKVKGQDDAADAQWFSLKELPELGFDHHQIIQQALQCFQDEKG